MEKRDSFILTELSKFISYPTISSDENCKDALSGCAHWLAQQLISAGMKRVKLLQTSSNPVVYAEYVSDPSFKTVLFYGHYDVQPVDPINKWHYYPFKSVIKGDYMFGRGVSDDKGQLFIHIKAVERLLKKGRPLPINVKFLIEGAEEIGSIGLKECIQTHKELLRCDVAVVSDTKMDALNVPAITYSLRGSLNAEIFIQTAKKDLHSGTFGGFAPNAALALSDFISKLYKKDNSIAIPGFYDDVHPVLPKERSIIRANGTSDKRLFSEAELFSSWGENEYSMFERSTIRPSLSITGITSGFQGKGVKSVIPSVASAKLNFRLVPGQRPERIRLLVDNYIRAMIRGARIKTVYSSLNDPVIVSRANPYIVAAAHACENVFGNKAKLVMSGGTIGAVNYLQTILAIPVILMGFAQAGDNRHAPNEKFYLPNLFRGIDTVLQFIQNVSSLNHKTISHAAADH